MEYISGIIVFQVGALWVCRKKWIDYIIYISFIIFIEMTVLIIDISTQHINLE